MEALDETGFNPRRTTPRTMCLMSASGCSAELTGLSDFNRAQSVFDLVEVDLRFTLCGFAERDDADFMFTLRMNY